MVMGHHGIQQVAEAQSDADLSLHVGLCQGLSCSRGLS